LEINGILDSLPELSPGINQLLELLRSDFAPPEELERLLIACPVIAGKVLQLSNSTFYGLSRQINSVKEATIILGQHTLRGLVYSLAVIEEFKEDQQSGCVKYEDIWMHSLYAACLSRTIAEKRGIEGAHLFTSSLFMHFGLIVLDTVEKEAIGEAFNFTQEQDVNFRKSVYKSTHIDYMKLSYEALNFWRFPTETCVLIKSMTGNDQSTELVILRFANFISASFFETPLQIQVP